MPSNTIPTETPAAPAHNWLWLDLETTGLDPSATGARIRGRFGHHCAVSKGMTVARNSAMTAVPIFS